MKRIIYLLSLYFLIVSCEKKNDKDIVYKVNVTPDSTINIKTSDIFDSYRVFHINDDEFYIVRDYAFYRDKILVNMYCNLPVLASGPQIKLRVYDYTGNYLYQIGAIGRGHGEYYNSGDVIFIEKDSTVSVINDMQIINYNIDNSVNWQKLFNSEMNSSQINGAFGRIRAELNDSCYIILNPLGQDNMKYKLAAISKDNKKIYHMFLEKNEEEMSSSSNDDIIFYKYDNKLNIYNYADNSIYELTQDSAILRYKIADKANNKKIRLLNINETKNYLFINQNIIYDKIKNESYYFNITDDIILPRTMPDSLKVLTFRYSNKRSINDNRMFFELKNCFLDFDIQNKITTAKGNMSEKEWENYSSTRPDVIEIYNRLPEKRTEEGGRVHIPFILSYKFKSDI